MEAEFYQAGLSNQFSHIRICEFSHVICLALVLVSFLDAPGITAWTHRSQSDTHRDHGQGAIASSWHFPRGIIRYHKLCAKNCEVKKSPIRFRYFEFVRYLRSLEPTKTPHSMEVRPAHISWKLGEQFQKDCTTESFEFFPRQVPNILKPRHPSWGHTIRCVDWNWRWHWQPGTLPWHMRAWQSKFHILVNDVALELGGRVLYIPDIPILIDTLSSLLSLNMSLELIHVLWPELSCHVLPWMTWPVDTDPLEHHDHATLCCHRRPFCEFVRGGKVDAYPARQGVCLIVSS